MRKIYIIKDVRKTLAQQINNLDTAERTAMENIPFSSTGLSAVIPKDNDGYCTVYKMDCADGLGLMTVYQVYPGIQLIYNDFEATSCYWDGNIDKNILEINHCREGREGCRLPSGSCLYLGEGDLSIHTMDNCASEMSFPLKHYRGISVVINLSVVVKNPPEILSDSGIDILQFKEKFCADGNCFIMRAKNEIEHIFSELYSVPDCLQKPYFRLKVQELLNRPVILDELKTKAAERNIPLPVCLSECLKEAKATSTSEYVVSNRDGEPLSYTQFKRLWQYIVTRTTKERVYYRYEDGKRIKHTVTPVLGEKAAHNGKVTYSLDFEVTPHQLRHTYITNLIHASVDPKTVQYLAGHESCKITMDIYAKVKYNRPDELVKTMSSAFAGWDNAEV